MRAERGERERETGWEIEIVGTFGLEKDCFLCPQQLVWITEFREGE